MSVRTILIVILALVFGGSVAFGINTFLKQRRPAQQAAQQPVAMVPVVIAADDIPRFADVTEEMVRIKQFPRDLMPPGSIGSLADVVGRVTFVSVAKGEAFSTTRLSDKGVGRGMAAAIPKGMRAYSINTPNAFSSVAGFIIPGSRVDVVLTVKQIRINELNSGTKTETLLQNVEVLAVDQNVEAPTSGKVNLKELRSVTLLVTPDEVNELDNGQSRGTLHLSLRNPKDNTQSVARPASTGENGQKLSGTESAVNVAPAPPKKNETPAAFIRTIRGVDSNVVELR